MIILWGNCIFFVVVVLVILDICDMLEGNVGIISFGCCVVLDVWVIIGLGVSCKRRDYY